MACDGEDVYESTNGAGWTGDGVQRGWAKTNTPCASGTDSNAGWFGVDCEDGYVSALFLAGHHLTGTLPPSIGDLTGLTTLHLYDNPSLNGEIPTSFTNLTNLEDCKLDNTTLTAANPTVETFLINHCNW